MDIKIHSNNSANIKRVQKILSSQSERYVHLREIYLDRLPQFTEAFSRCPHEAPGGYRYDSAGYQFGYVTPEGSENGTEQQTEQKRETKTRYDFLCPDAKQRYLVHGILGRGTSGLVLAARGPLDQPLEQQSQWAIKLEHHYTADNDGKPVAIRINGVDSDYRYVPEEAVFMLFVKKDERFPAIDSVYVHGQCVASVMSSAYDGETRDRGANANRTSFRRYYSFNGEAMTDKKKPKLSEVEVCKVASEFLGALMYLRDMGIVHDDLSLRNFVVKQNLDVQVLDLGLIRVGRSRKEFQAYEFIFTPYMEYQMLPEAAIELSKPSYHTDRPHQSNVFYPHDVRGEDQWKFACIVYELAHGYAPWEDPEWNEEIDSIRHWGFHTENENPRAKKASMKQRRKRIINDDVPMAEGLDQDCADVLQSLLARNPDMRPDPTNLDAVASFPWFQGRWVDQGPFQRRHPST